MARETVDAELVAAQLRRQMLAVLWLVLAAAAAVTAFAVTIAEVHVHRQHIDPLEERVERLECYFGLEPGEDTSDDFPFLRGHERARCAYPRGPVAWSP